MFEVLLPVTKRDLVDIMAEPQEPAAAELEYARILAVCRLCLTFACV